MPKPTQQAPSLAAVPDDKPKITRQRVDIPTDVLSEAVLPAGASLMRGQRDDTLDPQVRASFEHGKAFAINSTDPAVISKVLRIVRTAAVALFNRRVIVRVHDGTTYFAVSQDKTPVQRNGAKNGEQS